MYTLKNSNGLFLTVIDSHSKDYSFTNEERLALKFSNEGDATGFKMKNPLLKLKVVPA